MARERFYSDAEAGNCVALRLITVTIGHQCVIGSSDGFGEFGEKLEARALCVQRTGNDVTKGWCAVGYNCRHIDVISRTTLLDDRDRTGHDAGLLLLCG